MDGPPCAFAGMCRTPVPGRCVTLSDNLPGQFCPTFLRPLLNKLPIRSPLRNTKHLLYKMPKHPRVAPGTCLSCCAPAGLCNQIHRLVPGQPLARFFHFSKTKTAKLRISLIRKLKSFFHSTGQILVRGTIVFVHPRLTSPGPVVQISRGLFWIFLAAIITSASRPDPWVATSGNVCLRRSDVSGRSRRSRGFGCFFCSQGRPD